MCILLHEGKLLDVRCTEKGKNLINGKLQTAVNLPEKYKQFMIYLNQADQLCQDLCERLSADIDINNLFDIGLVEAITS